MLKPKKISTAAASNAGATVGYEARLWQMADALRGSMDAGQESNYTTWRFAKMNLAIRGRYRPRRHLPQRPPPRPQGRLHPRQSALQRERLGR